MTILVTGATGSVGRLVVDELVALGAPVRALTVNPEKAALPPEVEVVTGYLGRPATLPAALKGIDAVYLAPLPDTVEDFTALALEAGVGRVVALSGSNADEEEREGSSGAHYIKVERAVEAAGFDWTFVRPGVFANNTLGWADEIKASGTVSSAYPHAAQTPIDLRDIARVAAKVLTESGHTGRRYPLSGPESITQAGQVEAVAAALGTGIRFHELTREEHRERWLGYGIPAEVADWLLDGFAEATEHPQVPEPGYEELMGHPGTTYAQWAADNAEAFR
ncbi:NAD(P)H-binding protein [Amycolatopsis magusensis]|uniref:NAD(P)H-binding protein n=1 Tax=Amycolatopsis magusensis TaxID=882444 RepID=UPI0024A9C3DD|nr:NAD(P)H-binding protein [Amycolatopsis magusensis]MDI5979743.1 NAD(P)H-binding protein [Amycolatopsis magusensis]